MRLVLALLLALLGLCLIAPAAVATTVPPMDEPRMRAMADVVIDGEVTGVESRFVGRRIVTFVTLVSGTAPSLTVTLVAVPGGVVDDIAQVVPGAPVLEPGRRYRLYLGRADGPRLDDRGPAARGVVGFWRGAFLLDERGAPRPFHADGRAPPLLTGGSADLPGVPPVTP